MNLPFTIALIAKHESFRATCYRDTRGFLTIGYGLNLDAEGADQVCIDHGLNYYALRNGQPITMAQAQEVLEAQVEDCEMAAEAEFPNWPTIRENAQAVVVDMIYNMGPEKFAGFRMMIAALRVGDYKGAAQQMKSSLWYTQVGSRGVEDVQLMLSA